MPPALERKLMRRRANRLIAVVTGIGLLSGATLLGAPAAVAGTSDPATVAIQLSLTGIATEHSPLGGSVVNIQPGDTVEFSAATAPTAGLDLLGLGSLVTPILGLLGYTVNLDASGLPGGKQHVSLTNSSSYELTFPRAGKYYLSWTAADLLGVINLNLNELQQAGVALNAQLGWTAEVDVAAAPAGVSVSLQLPSIAVQPSLPVVGTLPKITVPGLGGASSPPGTPQPSSSEGAPGQSTSSANGPGSTPTNPNQPNDPGPAQSAFAGGVGSTSSLSEFDQPTPTPTSTSTSTSTASTGKPSKHRPTPHYAENPIPAADVPVLLGLIGVVVLAVVITSYLRLFRIQRGPDPQ